MSVGPTRGPVQRPGLHRDLAEIFQRLEDLERVRAAAAVPTSDLLYDYTLPSDQRAIDTALDGPMAGSLSQDYAALEWCAVLRADASGVGTGYNAQLIINDDVTAAHYGYTTFEWNGAAFAGPVDNNIPPWRIPAASATANYFGQVKGMFEGYADSVSRFRTLQLWSGDFQKTGAATGFINILMGIWKDATPIDRIAVRASGSLDNLVAESRLSVFGRGKPS